MPPYGVKKRKSIFISIFLSTMMVTQPMAAGGAVRPERVLAVRSRLAVPPVTASHDFPAAMEGKVLSGPQYVFDRKGFDALAAGKIFIDPEVIRKLLRTLLISNPELRDLAAFHLREMVGQGYLHVIHHLAGQIDNEVRTTWHSLVFDNSVLIDRTKGEKDRKINLDDFNQFDPKDGSGPFRLYAVRVMTYAPKRNRQGQLHIKENPGKTGVLNFRKTAHFSLNGLVSGQWWDNPERFRYVVVVPLKDLIELNQNNFVTVGSGDTFFLRSVILPDSTKVFKATPERTALEQAEGFLRENTRVFKISGTFGWSEQPIEKKFREYYIKRNISYGHHGLHWTLRFENVAEFIYELYYTLIERRDKIQEWLDAGGSEQLDDVEALDTEFPWWHRHDLPKMIAVETGEIRFPTFRAQVVTRYSAFLNRYMRLMIRQFLEDPSQSVEEFIRGTLERLGTFVPENEKEIFEGMKEQGENYRPFRFSSNQLRRALARLEIKFNSDISPRLEEIDTAHHNQIIKALSVEDQMKIERALFRFHAYFGFYLPLAGVNRAEDFYREYPTIDTFWKSFMKNSLETDGLRALFWTELTSEEFGKLEKAIVLINQQHPKAIRKRVEELLSALTKKEQHMEIYSRFITNLDILLRRAPFFFGWGKEKQVRFLLELTSHFKSIHPLTPDEMKLIFRLLELPEDRISISEAAPQDSKTLRVEPLERFLEALVSSVGFQGFDPEDLKNLMPEFEEAFDENTEANVFQLNNRFHFATIGMHSLQVARNIDQALLEGKKGDSNETTTLRITAIFHDMGKIYNNGLNDPAGSVFVFNNFLHRYPQVREFMKTKGISYKNVVALLEESVHLSPPIVKQIRGERITEKQLEDHASGVARWAQDHGGFELLDLLYRQKIADVMAGHLRPKPDQPVRSRFSTVYKDLLEKQYRRVRELLVLSQAAEEMTRRAA